MPLLSLVVRQTILELAGTEEKGCCEALPDLVVVLAFVLLACCTAGGTVWTIRVAFLMPH